MPPSNSPNRVRAEPASSAAPLIAAATRLRDETAAPTAPAAVSA
jgi:hypothetical protein